jgi:hypothetical protein
VSLLGKPRASSSMGKLVKHYTDALLRLKESGVPQRMVVVVDSYDSPPRIEDAPDVLDLALGRARKRGVEKVAQILKDEEMLTAEAFGKEIDASRETVNTKRHRHEVLGLEGPTRGVRFPRWQLSESGQLLPGLPRLFAAVGGDPWTVYRFLLQDHPELGSKSGLDALREGRVDEVISVAESIGRGTFP